MSDQPFDARSPGEMLRIAREKQGLHIAALAAAIKVAPRKLEALEADRWDELPDATFVRALAQTVCRTLKIDAAPVLALLPPASGLALQPVSGGLNAPFRDRPGRDEPGLALGARRPMVLAAAVLVLAAMALIFLPERFGPAAFLRGAAAPASAASAPVAGAAVAAAAAPAASTAETAAGGTAAGTGLFPPADAVPVLAAVPPATLLPSSVPPVAPAPAAIAPAAPASVPAAASEATGVLQVRTTGASWIEARDASGRILLSRMVQAGERVGLDGGAPLRLTIGNAAVTRLDFRGQPVDLLPSTRDNVARVELK
jgi:cytoskeleton protein RodZ